MLARDQEFLAAGNRSGGEHALKAGATKDGKLVAFLARVSRTGGVNGGGGSNQPQPYIYAPRVSYVESRGVWTNLDASRAMRAPGHPQASFAMEGLIDELAYAIGMDPLEFRIANLPDGGREAYARQLRRCAEVIGWKEHPHKTSFDASDAERKVGIGFALSTWGGGGNNQCKVDVRIASDGSVEVACGTQDLGTGTRTYMAAIVAEELGLELAQVTAKIGRSSYGNANGSGGSTTAASLAPSVKHAAHRSRLALFERVAPLLGAKPSELAIEPGKVALAANRSKSIAWKDACAALGPQGLSERGEWQSDLAGNGVQGAQAAKVEVDTLTGAVRVLHMVCVQNCGLALNRMAAESQILGGMVQALSYGLFEERVVDPDLGIQLNANFVDYKIAGCREIGRLEAILDDGDERGVIGIGEPPVIPGQSAIANAIYNACGVRLREMPFTADRVLMGLVAQRKG
jgi:xanthine dehydrogenase YagR molybdenum-binding subunit